MDNDRIFISTSYMQDSAAVSWAAAHSGILSPEDTDAFSGEIVVHMDGRATVKWWDGPDHNEEPFVLVIDPSRANGSYVTVYETEDDPPDSDAPVRWTSIGGDALSYSALRDFLDRYANNEGVIQGDPATIAGEAVGAGLAQKDEQYNVQIGD